MKTALFVVWQGDVLPPPGGLQVRVMRSQRDTGEKQVCVEHLVERDDSAWVQTRDPGLIAKVLHQMLLQFFASSQSFESWASAMSASLRLSEESVPDVPAKPMIRVQIRENLGAAEGTEIRVQTSPEPPGGPHGE